MATKVSKLKEKPNFPDVNCYGIPFTEIAVNIGKAMVKNIVPLGALRIFSKKTFFEAIKLALKSKCALIPLNEEAFEWGAKAVKDLEK